MKKGRPLGRPFLLRMRRRLVVVAVMIDAVMTEVEEIAERRAVDRHIGIIVVNDGVRKIIAAAIR